MHWLTDLLQNPFLITGLSSWLLAQILKTIIHAAIHKSLDITRLFGDGGMPSGHSATASSLATICALICGTGSVEFALAAVLAIIVCHDAMGVRRETGKQAVVLNELIEAYNDFLKGNDQIEEKLKVFVGHTPTQVLAGIILGVANAFGMYYLILPKLF